MDPIIVTVIATGLSVLFTVGGIIWKFSTYLAKSFETIKDLINNKIDTVLNKLEYHEQHDDKRFGDINNSLWELRIQNALLSKQGVMFDQETIKSATQPRTGRETPSS